MINSSVFGFLLVLSSQLMAQTLPDLPEPQVRALSVLKMASEMERLDGEALFVRQNRSFPWSRVVNQLQGQALDAHSWPELIRVFQKLNEAYPNLHSNLKLGPKSEPQTGPILQFDIEFAPEWRSKDEVRFVVSRVGAVLEGKNLEARAGDELLAINGRELQSWKDENFEFCKFPLRSQCDNLLFEAFQREVLSWNRSQNLSYTLRRGQRTWVVKVPFREKPAVAKPKIRFACRDNPTRYEKFQLIYRGNRTCVYQNPLDPATALLWIAGFSYSPESFVDGEKILNINDEIEALWPWWQTHARWDHLIIDVIDNHGGNAPLGYYQLLLQHDFQEQFVTFKKTPEMENPVLRDIIFWGSREHEIWFQNLVAGGSWSQLKWGEYTSPVPMFCARTGRDCREGLFPSRPHPFRGRVSVLLNQWCVSSCDGFVFNLKDKLGDRVRLIGHPQAADTAFSRLRLNLFFDSQSPDGFRIQIAPLYSEIPEDVFLSQTLGVSRSTTESGEIVSGRALAIDDFVPLTLENRDRWHMEALQRALESPRF